MNYFKIEFGEYKNWSEVDAAWKAEKLRYYDPPRRCASHTDLRSFMIPEYGDEPYFTRTSNPTLKEVKEYIASVIESIGEKELDLDEFTVEISAGVYWRENGFQEYEPTGEYASLDTITVKLMR